LYGSALGALSLISVISPLPLTAGDEAVIVGDQAVPVYWPTGGQAGTVPPGWLVRVTSAGAADGFREVVGRGENGQLVTVLIHEKFLGP
jgi:hypothetical protein